jgi:protease II
MYDKDKDSFTLMVRDLVTGTLYDKPCADRVSNISWAMDGKALVYIVTNEERRPYRSVIFLYKSAHLCFFFHCTITVIFFLFWLGYFVA